MTFKNIFKPTFVLFVSKIFKRENLMISVVFWMLFVCHTISYASKFDINTSYQTCFTPGQDCTSKIIKVIESANSNILVQAYQFTSFQIAKALVNAKKRYVKVEIILDKSQIKEDSFSQSYYLAKHNIPIWIDYLPNIAHNKVIVIDSRKVVTGSFNFTKAAQYKNRRKFINN